MRDGFLAKSTICPFYKCEDESGIVCEGIVPHTSIKVIQNKPHNKAYKRQYKETYCDTFQYGECPIATVLNQKYEKKAER